MAPWYEKKVAPTAQIPKPLKGRLPPANKSCVSPSRFSRCAGVVAATASTPGAATAGLGSTEGLDAAATASQVRRVHATSKPPRTASLAIETTKPNTGVIDRIQYGQRERPARVGWSCLPCRATDSFCVVTRTPNIVLSPNQAVAVAEMRHF